MESHKDVFGLTKQLQQAVSLLDEKKVSELLAKGALPSLLVNNITALHLAVRKPLNANDEKKALTILVMLLDNGGNINQMAAYRTVMNLAGHNSFWQAVLLIAANKKTDAHDSGHYGSALLDAVRFCDDEELLQNIVFTLLEQGAKANRHSRNDGYTALHWAVAKGKAFVLRMLLAKFSGEYLRRSVETESHPVSVTPARMAFNLQKWDCLWAIAEVAYLPIIEGRCIDWPKELENEKDIIFKYVCSFPPTKKWAAILAGLDKTHALRKLNDVQTGVIPSIGKTTTVRLYKEEKKLMEEQGFPDILKRPQPVLPAQGQLRTSPQLFHTAPQSVPRIITNYVSVASTSVGAEPEFAATPLFTFSPPQESSTPSPSTTPQEFLAELFSGRTSPQPHTSTDDGVLRGPHRF